MALLALAGACGGSSSAGPSKSSPVDFDDAGPGKTSGLPCDVRAVLTKNCGTCHAASPQYGAPMSLVTWDDLNARSPSDESKKIADVVLAKVADDVQPMPPPPNARLSLVDRKVLGDWVAAGTPKGPDSCEGVTPPPGVSPLSCTPDAVLEPSEPWTMPADVDDEYVCFGVDLKRTTPTHITGFAPKIDNTKIVHHVVVYEASKSFPSKPEPCSSGGSIQWRMVLGWAPGSQALELPAEAGFRIGTDEPTHYVVQMHYSNVQKLAGEKDASKVELCTGAPRKYEADVLAFGTHDFRIPAQPPAGGVFKRECSVTVPAALAGIHVFGAMPHMHKLGRSMTTLLKPKAGGPDVDLGSSPNFDFGTQLWYPVDATTATGDVITTTCGWTNNTGAEVGFGEKTADEMCYSFTMYYPRIASTTWSWAFPAVTSTCKTL